MQESLVVYIQKGEGWISLVSFFHAVLVKHDKLDMGDFESDLNLFNGFEALVFWLKVMFIFSIMVK